MSETDERVKDIEALAAYARLDWVVFGKWERLHNPVEFTADPDEWNYRNVKTACGLRPERAYVPGIFTRMGAPRCASCCDHSDYPRGVGSPKNDDRCRPRLGLPPTPNHPAPTHAGETEQPRLRERQEDADV